MSSQNIIEGNTDKPCACCHRTHRKLFLVGGFWLGRNCAEDYNLFKWCSDVNTLQWKGCEKKHAKVMAMVEARNATS